MRVRTFLSENDVSFVCYAKEVKADNAVVGLSEEAENPEAFRKNSALDKIRIYLLGRIRLIKKVPL